VRAGPAADIGASVATALLQAATKTERKAPAKDDRHPVASPAGLPI